ncbi:Structural maintenance of chromosomes protein 4 [Frankliniella fusca]|uniref:Structural maintenance of chromosomes protein n=1 Tax=Frankliniella fusca TaxID=407009 RepID=A0AAE1LUF4_9NEOP|nr:Structural maintenance of chromosomes protein 4 [Frankliniella fusca]
MSARRRSRGNKGAGEDVTSPEGERRPQHSNKRHKEKPAQEDSSSDESSPVRRSPPKKSKTKSANKDAGKSPSKTLKAKTPTKEQPPQEDTEMDIDKEVDHDDEEMYSDEEGGIRIGDIYIPPPPPTTAGTDQNGPRLIITHIENENFKSYAGKTTLGPFHKCFTSIVGPNGSGKSNVIDSMLFVFGYRASKIRSKKISVLLHNSDEHKNVQSCTVAVHFKLIIDKPGDDYEEVPGSNLVIARTAFRDNSSYYTLNGKRVQFKEVAKLLRSHGIDLDHNRFLILQGEVEQIALMKPKGQTEHDTGMLEFLEDIIGTSRFKEPIEKLNALVETLSEDRTEKLNRVKMVEKEKEALEGPKEESVKALKQENQYSQVMHLHCQKYIRNLEVELEKSEEKKKELDEVMSKINEELKGIQDELHEKEKAQKTEMKQIEKMESQKNALSEQFDKINNQDVQLAAFIQQTNKKRKRTQDQLEKEKETLKELQNLPEKNEKEIEELKTLEPKLVKQQEEEQKEVEAVMATIAVEAKSLTEKKDKLQNRLVGLTEASDEQRSKLDISKKELDLYLMNETNARKRYEDLKASYDTQKEKISEAEKAVAELPSRIEKMEKEVRSMRNDLAKANTEAGKVSEELREKRTTFEAVKSDRSAKISHNACLNYLMDMKRSGTIPGIIGRLGDLGGIDQKYDVAVSTACPMLDYILVDTLETGQMCIDSLKADKVGRANFIILEKQEHYRQKANSTMQTPENVPRLFDLVRIRNENYRTAFYFALRDTMVAQDLDQASRIGYGRVRHRVVTLKGEVIETSGTMSGGGRAIQGKMGNDSRSDVVMSDAELRDMESKVERLLNRENELLGKIAGLENTIKSHTRQIANDRDSLELKSLELQTLSKNLPEMQDMIKKQEKIVKESVADAKHVKALEAKIASIEKELKKAEEAEGKVSNEVQSITNEIEKLTSGRVQKAQKKLDGVSTQLGKVRSEITRLGVAIKTAERNAKKSGDKIKNLTKEIEDMKESLAKMVADKNKITEEGAEVCKMLEAVVDGIREKQEQMKGSKEELDEIRKRETKLSSKKMDEDQKLKYVEQRMKDKKSAIGFTKNKMVKLTLHVIPGSEKRDEFVTKTPEELDELDADNLQYEVARLEGIITKNKPNMGVIEEYNRKEAQYLQRVSELEAITAKRNEIRSHHDEARKKRMSEFLAGFTTITGKLKEMYQMITLGGDAELELCDSLDPFAEGIVFSVRPPKKSWKNISNLSGGEKTLSSLALVFALHYYKPTPLYVMDEIDAALDFKNVSIVANYIKERTKNAQFIIISLRSNMFELADTLVGIFKTYNATKTVTINPKHYGSVDPGRLLTALENEKTPPRRGTVTSPEPAVTSGPIQPISPVLPDPSVTGSPILGKETISSVS